MVFKLITRLVVKIDYWVVDGIDGAIEVKRQIFELKAKRGGCNLLEAQEYLILDI